MRACVCACRRAYACVCACVNARVYVCTQDPAARLAVDRYFRLDPAGREAWRRRMEARAGRICALLHTGRAEPKVRSRRGKKFPPSRAVSPHSLAPPGVRKNTEVFLASVSFLASWLSLLPPYLTRSPSSPLDSSLETDH